MTGLELLLLILLILSAASLLAAAVGIGGRWNLGWLGVFFFVLAGLCQFVNSL